MNVLIIENEKPAADKISRMLKKTDSNVVVSGVLETVEETINWFQVNQPPDLILMDIQLDDGLCFEIFETINIEVPVIFTTAYDEYTLKAFKVNSVDYLLKPIDEDAFQTALNKFRKFHSDKLPGKINFEKLYKAFANQYKSRFLVKLGTRYRSVSTREVSYFHICERSTFLKDNQSKDYGIDYSLDQLQKVLDPEFFFRINRDCIVSINAISLIKSYSSSRVQLALKNEKENEIFVVSRDKVGLFKKWVDK
jgi:DNA-binding LytR/AlgR family response regulator